MCLAIDGGKDATALRGRRAGIGLERSSAPCTRPPKLSDKQAVHLIAVAYSDASDGHNHWTLRLLADKVVELNYADSCSYKTIRQLLKKHA